VPEENMETTEPASADTPEVSLSEVSQEPVETYVVKVDGAEQQVSLSELQDGYQRQADYTRKTQELASERQRLQQAESIAKALESDPSGTISALSSAFGLDTQATQEQGEAWDELDPTEQRIARIEHQMEQQAVVGRRTALDKEVSGLKSKYGDFDEQELFNHALHNQISNLDAAYAHMRFGTVSSTAEKLQADKDVTDSKRGASLVESKTGTQKGSVVSQSAGKPMSIREAFAMAKQELTT